MSRRELCISRKHASIQLTLFPEPSSLSLFDQKFLADCGIATDGLNPGPTPSLPTAPDQAQRHLIKLAMLTLLRNLKDK